MGARPCRLLLQPNKGVPRQDIFLDLNLDIEKMAEEKKETQVNGATLSSSTTKREAPTWRSVDDVRALQFGSRSKLR
jgi:hypothetical protein